MRHCLYCDARLTAGDSPSEGPHRQAYDPHLGRLWDVCPRCRRWSPVPLELRWEAMEAWEARVRDEGRALIETPELSLLRVGDDEVVRVGKPLLPQWGAWRYGTRLPRASPPESFLARLLRGLPPPPLEGYDPYGLTGPMGGVGGKGAPSEWLASPFMEAARPLTLAFTSVPLAPSCPSCARPMALHPWDFQNVAFRWSAGAVCLEARCAQCGDLVLVRLGEARPAIRMGLAILDSGPDAHEVGEAAGEALARIGGRQLLLRGLGSLGAPLGDLARTERVALGIALDQEAEGEALEAKWREAEEVAAALDGTLADQPAFREFRARVLGAMGD